MTRPLPLQVGASDLGRSLRQEAPEASLEPLARDHGSTSAELAALLGYAPGTGEAPDQAVHQSAGTLGTELLRRFEPVIGDRVSDGRTEHAPLVRQGSARGVLERVTRERTTLPPEHPSWAERAARDQPRRLTDLGVQVLGGPKRSVPDVSAVEALPEVTDQEVASAATEAIADSAVQPFSGSRRRQARSATAGDGARGPADAE